MSKYTTLKVVHEITQDCKDTTYPPSKSAETYNAFYLKGCDHAQRSPSYTSCLFKINETEAGRTHWSPECETAIQRRECPAMAMRDEEKLAGKAMFFQQARVHRGFLITNLTPVESLPTRSEPGAHISADPRAANYKGRLEPYIPPKNRDAKPAAAKPAPKREVGLVDTGSMADALNHALTGKAHSEVTPRAVSEPASAPVTLEFKQEVRTAPAATSPVQAAAGVTTKTPIAMLPGESPLAYARRVAASRQ